MVSIRFSSSECKRKRLHAGIQELDLEPPVLDRPLLPYQLMQPLVRDGSVPRLVHITAAVGARRLPVDCDPEPHTGPFLRWAHDQMKIARMELIHDPAVGCVQ